MKLSYFLYNKYNIYKNIIYISILFIFLFFIQIYYFNYLLLNISYIFYNNKIYTYDLVFNNSTNEYITNNIYNNNQLEIRMPINNIQQIYISIFIKYYLLLILILILNIYFHHITNVIILIINIILNNFIFIKIINYIYKYNFTDLLYLNIDIDFQLTTLIDLYVNANLYTIIIYIIVSNLKISINKIKYYAVVITISIVLINNLVINIINIINIIIITEYKIITSIYNKYI